MCLTKHELILCICILNDDYSKSIRITFQLEEIWSFQIVSVLKKPFPYMSYIILSLSEGIYNFR